jgi:hypothetical protein
MSESQQQPERLESKAQRNALWIGKHLKTKPQSGRNRQKDARTKIMLVG